jgi:hypothetical protein
MLAEVEVLNIILEGQQAPVAQVSAEMVDIGVIRQEAALPTQAVAEVVQGGLVVHQGLVVQV